LKNKLSLLALLFIICSLNLKANQEVININKIIQNASITKKQVMVFLHMDYCPYCQRMKYKTFKDTNIKKFIDKHFKFVDINIDKDGKVIFNGITYSKKDFSYSFDVDFFPTVLFFDKSYEITYTVRGYREIEKFNKILEYIQTKSYDKLDFFDYYKNHKDKE